jgi:hypothetical protein
MKTLKAFEFKKATVRAGYDWDTILSGEIVQMDEGVDFTCSVSSLQTNVTEAARKRGQTVMTNKVEGGLVVKASKPDPAAAAAYKEKLKAQAKKAAEKAKAKKAAEASENGPATPPKPAAPAAHKPVPKPVHATK